MKPKIYVETSIVSYLTARSSRDVVTAGNQEITRKWWSRRQDFELFISQLVLQEAAAGDPAAAAERLRVVEGIASFVVTGETIALAEGLVAAAALPSQARLDTFHIAFAALGGVDYLATWNCAHIANPEFRSKIEEVIRSFGYEPPLMCTPQELLEI